MLIAFLFSGQGSQYVGMGKELAGQFKVVRDRLEEASGILGYDLSTLCFSGPESELKKTAITQPALFTLGVAFAEVLKQWNIEPGGVAGHSLGEYSAACVAGVFSFADGVRLVAERGRLMQEASPLGEGGMMAILGIPADLVEAACSKVDGGHAVQVANYNSPVQTVISGSKEALEQASALCKEAGAKRVIPLEVSAPFHSQFMKPAAQKFEAVIHSVPFANPVLPLISNVTGQAVTDGKMLQSLCVQQLCSPVQWVACIQTLVNRGVETVIEVGPGIVLLGLAKKIAPTLKMLHIEDAKSLRELILEIPSVSSAPLQ